MRADEVAATGRVLGHLLAERIALIPDLHQAVADRSFGPLGPFGLPARAVHDAVAGAVYASVGWAARSAPHAAATVVGVLRPADAPSVVEHPRGRLAVGALNGLYGDRLAQLAPELDVGMGLYTATGRRLPDALDDPRLTLTGRLVVFVHGLCENDASWFRTIATDDGGVRSSFGDRLAEDHGWTPVYVRCNTGRRVSDNGAALAAELDVLVEDWPVRVSEIALVGHSMGGLIARSACHVAGQQEHGWVAPLRHVISLGTPHLGASLEKGTNALTHALGRLPETRGLARLLNRRSVGIKDLRYGSVVEEDWRGYDPDEFLRDRCTEVPFLPTATYSFIGVSVAGDENGPVARLVGDLLVSYPSASGRGRRRTIGFAEDRGRHLSGLHHLDLLTHPKVEALLEAWLGPEDGSGPRLARAESAA